EAFADRVLDLLDVDAIDRTGARALVAADAGGQVETVKPAVARLDRHGQFWILEPLGEGPSAIGMQEVLQGDVHPLRHRLDRHDQVVKPHSHEGPSAWAWARSRRRRRTVIDYRK